jgi:hypothetical protein
VPPCAGVTMATWTGRVGLTEVTGVPTDVEVVVPPEVREFVAARGGRLFVWISVHRGFRCTLALLETALEAPAGDFAFRRLHAEGFDVYLEATQRIWPKVLELALHRHRIDAYWNGLAWIA